MTVTIDGTSKIHLYVHHISFFFFQAEDGIRDLTVTGVQTCALPILRDPRRAALAVPGGRVLDLAEQGASRLALDQRRSHRRHPPVAGRDHRVLALRQDRKSVV